MYILPIDALYRITHFIFLRAVFILTIRPNTLTRIMVNLVHLPRNHLLSDGCSAVQKKCMFSLYVSVWV